MIDKITAIRQKIEDKEFHDASYEIDVLINESPNDEELLLLKSHCLYYVKKIPEAIYLLQSIIIKHPDCLYAHQLLSYCFIRTKDYEKALIIIDNAIKIDSNSFESYQIKAGILQELNRLPECINSLKKTTLLEPTNWKTHYFLANAIKQGKDYKEAYLEYKKAYRLKPSYQLFANVFLILVLRFRIIFYPGFLLLGLLSFLYKSPLLLLPLQIFLIIGVGESVRNKKWKNSIFIITMLLLLFFFSIRMLIS